MGSYLPSTESERQSMLAALGCRTADDLYADVPGEVKLSRPLDIPKGLSEMGVRAKMEGMAAKNTVFATVLRGAGAYRHYIPSIVKTVVSKEEFVTAYTPYQAEISQGVLQSIFEYQTMICELTGMDVSNASVYDGATAAAEAAAMCRDRSRTTVVMSGAVNPQVIETVKTYCDAAGAEVIVAPVKNGVTDGDALRSLLNNTSACFYLQQPNYFGLLEDAQTLGDIAHAAGTKYIMGCNPISLSIVKTPGECGADIAVGEGQPLGMPLSFGGPYLGFMACKAPLIRKLPGRIVGETTDVNGERAFVLTLQAREQHIRREKATSNICSNEALCAMTAAVYLGAMGPNGLRQAATQSMSKAHYLANRLCEAKGVDLVFSGEYFHEFVTTCPVEAEILLSALEKKGILGGYPLTGELAGCILWCATEANTKEEIDRAADIVKEVCRA